MCCIQERPVRFTAETLSNTTDWAVIWKHFSSDFENEKNIWRKKKLFRIHSLYSHTLLSETKQIQNVSKKLNTNTTFSTL